MDGNKNKSLYYNRTLYLKEFTKELTMVLPAQELKAAPPFSPILTQYGLNANEFCEKFNKETTIFPAGSLVPVSIFYIPKEKKFNFCFRPFQLKHILQQYVKYDEQRKFYIIDFIDLYKTLLIKSDILNEKKPICLLRNILGTLKSYERPLLIKLPKKILEEFKIETNDFNNFFFEDNLEEDSYLKNGEFPVETDIEEKTETDIEEKTEIDIEEKIETDIEEEEEDFLLLKLKKDEKELEEEKIKSDEEDVFFWEKIGKKNE